MNWNDSQIAETKVMMKTPGFGAEKLFKGETKSNIVEVQTYRIILRSLFKKNQTMANQHFGKCIIKIVRYQSLAIHDGVVSLATPTAILLSAIDVVPCCCVLLHVWSFLRVVREANCLVPAVLAFFVGVWDNSWDLCWI